MVEPVRPGPTPRPRNPAATTWTRQAAVAPRPATGLGRRWPHRGRDRQTSRLFHLRGAQADRRVPDPDPRAGSTPAGRATAAGRTGRQICPRPIARGAWRRVRTHRRLGPGTAHSGRRGHSAAREPPQDHRGPGAVRTGRGSPDSRDRLWAGLFGLGRAAGDAESGMDGAAPAPRTVTVAAADSSRAGTTRPVCRAADDGGAGRRCGGRLHDQDHRGVEATRDRPSQTGMGRRRPTATDHRRATPSVVRAG